METADELYLMTNLYPRSTGLPMVVWVGPRYGAAHDVRVKACPWRKQGVSMTHGQRMDPGNLAVVALRPQPHLIAGRLSAADLRAVAAWVALNQRAILDHWNELIDGTELGRLLQKLPP